MQQKSLKKNSILNVMANEPWTRAWVGETKVLIPQLYGEKRE